MRKTSIRIIAFFLIQVLILSLCACTRQPQTGTVTDEPKTSSEAEAPPSMPNKKKPDQPPPEDEGSDEQPVPTGFSEEAEQSLVWLRDRMDVPQTMFGAAFLGYTGEASDRDWLSEADPAMLQKYPFISEIDAEHTVLSDDLYLYCLVPVDENATVSINLVTWGPTSDNEEIIEVLYRSESGDPVLFWAACGDDAYAYLSYIQVQIVDSAGNSCVWYPQLDAMGCIVPCLSENGDYLSFDFTEYGWQDAPPELAPWLADGWSGIYAAGLEGSWTTQMVEDTGRTMCYNMTLYPEDETGGTVDLYWYYEDSDDLEAVWSGFWTITTVQDGPGYVTLDLSLSGGNAYGVSDGPYYLSETYPFLVSHSGMELVLGNGLQNIPLPFMPEGEMQLYELTWNFQPLVG